MSYEALASGYDGLMADAAYLRRADYLDRLFRRSGTEVQTVLDLACGTGTMALLLTQRGYTVTATDGSEEMLTEAMGKAAALPGQPPLFLHQTMPRLRLIEPVDAAICTMDSLNYLTGEKALAETLRRVGRWVKPGGWFYFDVNTPFKFRQMDHQVYLDETEESFCAWRTFFSEKTGICTYQVDLFTLEEDGSWTREYEEHRERAWPAETLRGLLEEAGFDRVLLTGDLTSRPPKETEQRWNFRCRRAKK